MIARRVAPRDLAAGALALAFAAVGAYESAKLPFGTAREPGPGFLPWWASLAVAFPGLLLLERALRPRAGAGSALREEGRGAGGWREPLGRVGGLLLALCAYVLLLEPLGYPLCTFLLVLFMSRATGRRRWRVALGTAAAIALGSYVLFAAWLGVPLPPGLLGW